MEREIGTGDMSFSFFIPGKPQARQRAGHAGGRYYDTVANKVAKRDIGVLAGELPGINVTVRQCDEDGLTWSEIE